MNYLLTEILVYLLIAGLIGVVLGWTIRGGFKQGELKKENALDGEKKQTPPIEHLNESDKTTPKTKAPSLLTTPREGGKDNLSLLKGIGPVVEEKLNRLGIYHLDQIASWNAEEQAWIDEQILFPRKVEREEWVRQAKELSNS